MAFQGYLLKIEGVILPLRFIAIDNYEATPNQTMDLDTYRDTTGILHRTVVPHEPSKMEFNTPAMTLSQMTQFKTYFPMGQKKISVEYWNDKTSAYAVGDFYSPDIKFKIYRVIGTDIVYRPIRVALIEY